MPSTLAVEPPRAIGQVESPSPAKKTVVTTLQQTKTVVAMSNLNGVFPEEEEEVDTLHQIKKKIKRFEITQEVGRRANFLNFILVSHLPSMDYLIHLLLEGDPLSITDGSNIFGPWNSFQI